MFRFQDPGKLIDGDLELLLVEEYPGDPAISHVPAYRFHMVHSGQTEKIGDIDLRARNTPDHIRYGGHIGYNVQPEHRGHRYASRACRLLFPLARLHGLTELWITCNPENMASARTCELAGAEFVEIVDLPETSDMYAEGERRKRRYRIRL